MVYSPENLPERYRHPWISSPETAVLEDQIHDCVSRQESFWLQGPDDCGKRHLLASAVLACDTEYTWEYAARKTTVAGNHPAEDASAFLLSAPSLDRRELIVGGRLQLAGALFTPEFVTLLAQQYETLTPLLGAVQYAIHFALLNQTKLNTINLSDILWAYDSSAN